MKTVNHLTLTLLSGLILIGCDRKNKDPAASYAATNTKTEASVMPPAGSDAPKADEKTNQSADAIRQIPVQPPAQWASQSVEKWPQLVLTNVADFDGHTPLIGGSAFLIKMPDGQVVMGSAKHLLTRNGGVTPPMTLGELDTSMNQWQIFPHNTLGKAILVKGIAQTTNNEKNHDWLLLNLLSDHATLPSTPLVPRFKKAQLGETVYMLGVPHSDKTSTQNVYKGVVTSRPSRHYFQYEFTPPVHIAGFSGAPIVDSNGLLLGQGLSMGMMKQVNGMEVEFGAEDACLAVWLYQHRSDPSAADPTQAIKITLPEDWTQLPAPQDALMSAEIPNYATSATLFATPKANLLEDITLSDWLQDMKPRIRVQNAANLHEGDIKPGNIGSRNTDEYESTGDIQGTSMLFRVIAFELNGCYCRVQCATPSEIATWAKPNFEKFILQVTSKG